MNPYYEPVTANYRSVNNQAAHAEWFESTEPGEEPKHSKITSVDRLEAIAGTMLGKLEFDLMANAKLEWKAWGTWRPILGASKNPLPAKNSPRQPLQTNRDIVTPS